MATSLYSFSNRLRSIAQEAEDEFKVMQRKLMEAQDEQEHLSSLIEASIGEVSALRKTYSDRKRTKELTMRETIAKRKEIEASHRFNVQLRQSADRNEKIITVEKQLNESNMFFRERVLQNPDLKKYKELMEETNKKKKLLAELNCQIDEHLNAKSHLLKQLKIKQEQFRKSCVSFGEQYIKMKEYVKPALNIFSKIEPKAQKLRIFKADRGSNNTNNHFLQKFFNRGKISSLLSNIATVQPRVQETVATPKPAAFIGQGIKRNESLKASSACPITAVDPKNSTKSAKESSLEEEEVKRAPTNQIHESRATNHQPKPNIVGVNGFRDKLFGTTVEREPRKEVENTGPFQLFGLPGDIESGSKASSSKFFTDCFSKSLESSFSHGIGDSQPQNFNLFFESPAADDTSSFTLF